MGPSFPWNAENTEVRLDASLEKTQSDPAAKNVYLKLLEDRARAQAKAVAGISSPLSGALISVKALFDVNGEVTTSATTVLQDDPPAQQDAELLTRLEAAGGIFTGLTNMSEFAYSGLGLNPHFGTPANPLYPGCAPGGSTSGGAVAVALGLCDIAIGSDTGGSLRIPAAFNGIVGFKPTQKSVPMSGGKPLSDSLDSFGPMAKSVTACELAWQVMADLELRPTDPKKALLIVPENFGLTDLDQEVAAGFEGLRAKLKAAGFEFADQYLKSIDHYAKIPPWHFTSVEGRGHYEDYFQNQKDQFDRRVHARMALADNLSAVEYRQSLNRRKRFVHDFAEELGARMILLPTTPILPPRLEDLMDDEDFNRNNLLALRNTSLANVADGCGIAIPFEHDGRTLSAMLIAPHGQDEALLACAKSLEKLVSD